MAWLFGDSCDGYATADLNKKYTLLGANGQEISVGTGSTSSNSIRFTNGNGKVGVGLATASPTLFSGRRLRVAGLSGSFGFHNVWDGPNERGHVVYVINGDGSISAWKQNFNEGFLQFTTGAGGFILGSTVPGLIQANVYASIQTKTTIHASDGFCGVIVNGAEVMAASGLNTQNPGGSASYSLAINGGYYAQTCDLDDLWFCDDVVTTPDDGCSDYLGDLIGEWRVASAVGASSGWTRNTGSTNVSCVDDVTPDSDSTYVEAATLGLTDMYGTGALARVTHGIKCVQVTAMAKTVGAGTRAIGLGVRVGAVDTFGADHYLTTDYAMQVSAFPLNPDTDLAWDKTEVDAAEIGQTLTI